MILDEPTLGFAPVICEEVTEKMKVIQGTGASILLLEQNMELAFELWQKTHVMERGEFAMGGRVEELRNNPRVRQAYLGL